MKEGIYGRKIVENGEIEREYDDLVKIIEVLAKMGCQITVTKEKDGKINLRADCCYCNDYR